MSSKAAPNLSLDHRHHAVQFYVDDEALCKIVAGFLSEGLAAGQPAIMIATAGHAGAIIGQLSARLVDVEKLGASGQLVVLDVADVLEDLMAGDLPDQRAFDQLVGRAIDDLLEKHPSGVVRAYGEIVDVLWKRGQPEAAIRLELMWNQLVASRGLALLCGYSMGNFYKQGERFEEVCSLHTRSTGVAGQVLPFNAGRAAGG
jgi:hypothetical protein